MSCEEIDLKKAERVQIARSVAIDRAIQLVEKGIAFEKIVDLTFAIEEYLKTGVLPQVPSGTGVATTGGTSEGSPSSQSRQQSVPRESSTHMGDSPDPKKVVSGRSARPSRLPSKAVNELFNQAKRAGLVEGWSDYEKLIRGVPKVEGKSPYTLDAAEFANVEAFLKPRLAQAKVA
jgi:hypothetical protein